MQVLPQMKEFQVQNLSGLKIIAEEICALLPENKIICFYGEMASGKTTLIKEILKQAGYSENVSSPTFSIVNEYSLPDHKKIFHFDFYRIKNIEEAYDLGYEEYFYSDNYCLIEWPEMVEELLPENRINVNIKVNSDSSRTFIIN